MVNIEHRLPSDWLFVVLLTAAVLLLWLRTRSRPAHPGGRYEPVYERLEDAAGPVIFACPAALGSRWSSDAGTGARLDGAFFAAVDSGRPSRRRELQVPRHAAAVRGAVVAAGWR